MPAVTFKPMDGQEYQVYLAHAVVEYAKDKVSVGAWPEGEALALSKTEYARYLPQGVDTPGQHLFCILNDVGTQVGVIWFGSLEKMPDCTFLFDFEIAPEYRRAGYGYESLKLLDEYARRLGSKTLELHVFGKNPAALALYQKAGYMITDINMRRDLA